MPTTLQRRFIGLSAIPPTDWRNRTLVGMACAEQMSSDDSRRLEVTQMFHVHLLHRTQMRLLHGWALVLSVLLVQSGALASSRSSISAVGVVNVNEATVQQLDLLPTVGGKVAARIVAVRGKTPFRTPAELTRVKGFGKKRFEKLKQYLTVSGPTTIRRIRLSAAQPIRQPSSQSP